jgi:hypothetical protein
MAAGVTDHRWTLAELIGLLEAVERVPVKRGPYKKRQPKAEISKWPSTGVPP